MKKLLLIPCLLVACLSNAQVGKGKILLGPSFNFQNSKNEVEPPTSAAGYVNNSKQTYVGGAIRLGYFLTDKIAAGIFFQNNTYNSKNENNNGGTGNYTNTTKNKDSRNYVGIFGRYYKMVGETKVGFFGQLDLALQFGKGKNTFESTAPGSVTSETSSKVSGFYAGLTPGIVFFVTEKVGLETSVGLLGFDATTREYTDFGGAKGNTTKNANLNLNFGMSAIYFGVHFYLGGKKE